MHGLFAADLFGRLEDPMRPTDQIAQIRSVLVEQEHSGFSLVIDQLRNDLLDPPNQLRFAFSKRRLVADLIKITHELRSFAE